MLIKSTRVSHQFLTKPCEPEVLKGAVTRNCLLFGLLRNDAIKSLAARMENLPSLPTLYADIMALLDSPATSIKQVGKVISKDLAMTAKILQIVNSSFFGFRRHISEPCQASHCWVWAL